MSEPRAVRRLPIVVAVVAILAGAVALEHFTTEADGSSSDTAAPSGPGVMPPDDATSAAWYCAAGSSVPDAAVSEELVLGNVGGEDGTALVTVYPSEPEAPAVERTVEVAARTQVRLPLGDVAVSQSPGVTVETFGGRIVVEHLLRGNDDVAVGPCATTPSRTWLFAAGSSARDVRETLSLYNPFADDAIVSVSLLTLQEGRRSVTKPQELSGLVIGRRSKIDVPISDLVQRADLIATIVDAREGRIVAERVLARAGDAPTGLALSMGAAGAAREWTFATSSTLEGRSVRLLVANPGERAVRVELEYRINGDTSVDPPPLSVPSQDVVEVNPADLVPAGFSYFTTVRVVGDGAVIAEQQLGWTEPAPAEGVATVVGSPRAATRWLFALGQLDDEGGGRIVVANPGSDDLTASVFVIGGGREPASTLDVAVPAGRSATVNLDEYGVDAAASIAVEADGPVVVERAIVRASAVSVAAGVVDPS